MNQSKRHKWADVLIAWAEGKEIQLKTVYSSNESWNSYNGKQIPDLDSDEVMWRIKPEVKTGWVNIFSENPYVGGIFNTKRAADIHHDEYSYSQNRIACIQISYTEGEGL